MSADGLLLLGAFWALWLLVLFLSLPRFQSLFKNPITLSPLALSAIVAGAALGARAIPVALITIENYDIQSFQIVADLILNHQDIYSSAAAIGRHPYLPLQMYWMALADRLAWLSGMPFSVVVKSAPIAADAGIAVLLFLALGRSGEVMRGFAGGLAYALNPISVFVSAYHGQFDSVPLFLALAAVVTLAASPLAAGGLLGLAILDKSWPVLCLPVLFQQVRKRLQVQFLVWLALVPALGVLFYAVLFQANMLSILWQATTYNHGIGIWGYGYFIRLLAVLRPELDAPLRWLVQYGRYLTLAGLAAIWFWKARRQSAEGAILTILVAFMALTHAFSIQYLVWIVPFALLNREHRWLTRFTLGAFSYMILAYLTLILGTSITNVLPLPQADYVLIMPAGLPAWLVTIGWIADRLRGESDEYRPRLPESTNAIPSPF